MRFLLYGCATVALTGAVIANAWMQRGQFFTAAIHLTRSSSSLMVLLNMGLYVTVLAGRALQRLFFGRLRALEVEHLYERSWFAVTETCLAMTIFRDQFDVRFIVLFAMLLLVKIFHWLSQDRVDFMEQSPNPSLGWHLRMQIMMALLTVVDLIMVLYSVQHTTTRGASMMIIFGFEYTILLSLILSTFVKYLLHSYDLRRDTPWEEKSMYIFYVDLLHDFEKLVTYICFFAIVVYYYSLPLHIVRDLYMTLRSFVNRCRDLIQYRRATANMNERYPDATVEDLNGTDRVCIICREEMEVAAQQAAPAAAAAGGAGGAAPVPPQQDAAGASNRRPAGHPDTPKKLNCGHIFHFHCLKSWLERQQSCPTCRRSVLEQPTPPPTAPANAAAAAAAQQQPPAAAGGAPALPNADFQAFLRQHQQQFAGGMFHGLAGAAPPPQPPQPPQQPAGSSSAPGATAVPVRSLPTPLNTAFPPPPHVGAPGVMYPITLTPLIPLSGANLGALQAPQIQTLDHLTDAQLRDMDGQSREAISARIRALQSVQSQITGIITQLTQISTLIPPPKMAAGSGASGVGAGAGGEASGGFSSSSFGTGVGVGKSHASPSSSAAAGPEEPAPVARPASSSATEPATVKPDDKGKGVAL
ncbi:uncharacterized protein EV422DRAFT_50022 [Fimicolochytrium jonesii]|uniref:uncharacterized protein n=1 Tax=Fimicolochytrium jonesii TaxID=1396493 RepID=UPI0022FF0E1A|nr:uncharacterized protein EV422DRAFT_50022 [Fimicolochytrium jonesii]KAI8821028.1 hypothetical protein EV422DRAFT_50022 [Fimicolochytrium jonesii]